MSAEQIRAEALSLPISGRVALAQALWASISSGRAELNESEAVSQAAERDRELSTGAVAGRSHEQVIAAARRAIGYD